MAATVSQIYLSPVNGWISRVLLRSAVMAALSVVVTGTTLIAQPLDSLVRLAVEHHPSIEAARLAVRQADARARAAEAWDPPGVGVDFRMLPPSNPNPAGKGETMVMVEQMIPLFGQKRAMADAMAVGTEVGQAGVASARRRLRTRVEREYYTLWLLDRRLELNGENSKLADQLYKSVETRYVANTAGQSDLLRVEVEIERLNTERKEIEQERIEAVARLNALLVRPVETPVAVDPMLAADSLPSFQSLDSLIADNPDLRRMEAMAKMSRVEADAESAMLKPMLMLRGGLTYMPEGHPVREANVGEHGLTTHGDGVMKFGLSAGATLSIPIAPWSRSGPEGRAEALRIESEKTLDDRDAMRLDMTAMLRSTYAQAQRASLKLSFYRDTQGPLLERTLDALRADYINGRTPFSSVLDGYSSLIMTRMDGYMQQMEYSMALSMINEIVGAMP